MVAEGEAFPCGSLSCQSWTAHWMEIPGSPGSISVYPITLWLLEKLFQVDTKGCECCSSQNTGLDWPNESSDLLLTHQVCQGNPILPGECVVVDTGVLRNLLIYLHSRWEFGTYLGTLGAEQRVSWLCLFPGGWAGMWVGLAEMWACTWASGHLQLPPAMCQGAKSMCWTTGEDR